MKIFSGSVPESAPTDIIFWADNSGLKVDGHSFDSSRTPQLIEPMRAMADADTRIGTLIKPVQVGGSTAGEIVCAYWAAFSTGLIQFNWEHDMKATNRWQDRIARTLESCRDIRRTKARFEETICEARFVNATIRCQGVFKEDSLDSDTVPLQINEEIHSWKPGFLSKARRRQTQVWNAKAFDISNAGMVGDQLHSAYEDGTCEEWEVLCPKCGSYHVMKFRFDPKKPEAGGLRWDSDGCKMENGRFNYNKLEGTIRYQMPCGLEIKDFAAERRTLKGRYSKPRNEGAHVSHRSWNFEAVSCDSIRWLTLIQEWHGAIRALKTGDNEPMRRFVQERECKFYSADSIPYAGRVVLNTSVQKTREGYPDRAARIAAFDWQQGYKHKGQLIHYWGVIEDVRDDCNSVIVWEGMVNSEVDLIELLKEYQVEPIFVMIDASKNTKQILQFCYQNGFKAVSGTASHVGQFRDHEDRQPRFYSAGKPIYKELNVAPLYDLQYGHRRKNGDIEIVPHPLEPIVIQYNLGGLLANHFFIREIKAKVAANCQSETPPREPKAHEYFERVIPGDVSEDFIKQVSSWERVGKDGKAKAGDIKSHGAEAFRQTHPDDHLLQCLAYIDLFKDWSLLLGNALTNLGIEPTNENEKQNQD